MNKKGVFIGVILATLCCFFAVNSAWAGNVQRNRWEGVAIGIGAAILGSALFNHHRNAQPPPPAVVYHHPAPPPWPKAYYHTPHYPRHERWEIRKIWVPPTYKRVWNPAHYTQDGQWVIGAWIEIVDRPGYWREECVRASRR